LGDELYFRSLHQYINDWHGKHPVPYDFFYSFNNASGKNLNWFWNKWFFGWSYPDLSIKKVEKSATGTKITIEDKGGLPLPVYLSIISRGKKSILKFNAEIWKDGKKERIFSTKNSFTEISKIILGNEFIPDKFKEDNEWMRK